MSTLKIEVEIKSKYGRDLIYPADDISKLFLELLKQTTFTKRDIALIVKLGYDVQVIQSVKTL